MRNTLTFVVITAAAFGQLPPAEQRVADFTELLVRKPDFASAYYARGLTRLSMRQYLDAEQDLSKTIELRPDATAYASRAEVYAATKRNDQEIADLSMAMSLKPGDMSYYLRRANSYSGKGECQAAILDYSGVIAKGPSEAAYRGRSACRKQSGDKAGAAEDLRIADQMKASPTLAPVPLAPIPPPPPRGFTPPVFPPPAGTGGGIGTGTGGGVATKPPAARPSPENVYKIGGGVSQPSILFKVEPEYSEEARKAKWQGTVNLSVVISEFGEPINLKVTNALGLGLDQKAIEAVQKWVFKPGRKDGQPVAVYANIQVTFKLL
jgi:TonB family protein